MSVFTTGLFQVLLWGLVATILLTGVMFSGQSVGYSRLTLPFLIGTLFTGRRGPAHLAGLLLYLFGGWLFAMAYVFIFSSIGDVTWWIGALIGAGHALLILVVVMPILPYLHPRMASPHGTPESRGLLHPPGFLALHYGYPTPLVTIAAHACYGAVLAAAFPFQ